MTHGIVDVALGGAGVLVACSLWMHAQGDANLLVMTCLGLAVFGAVLVRGIGRVSVGDRE